MYFKLDNSKKNQIKYGLIKEVNVITNLLKNGLKKLIQKCIEHITKENLLFLKDLLEL